MSSGRTILVLEQDKAVLDDLQMCFQMLDLEGVITTTMEKFKFALGLKVPAAAIVRFLKRDTAPLLQMKAELPKISRQTIWIAVYDPSEEKAVKSYTSLYRFSEALPLELPAFPHKLQEALGGGLGAVPQEQGAAAAEVERVLVRQLESEMQGQPAPQPQEEAVPTFNSNVMLLQALQLSIADEYRHEGRTAGADPELLPEILRAATERVLQSKQVLKFLGMVGANRRKVEKK